MAHEEKLFDLNAVPTKEVLRNKAKVCPPLSALCEILDNIFDNYDENGCQGDLSVEFAVKTKGEGSLSITENSGGVRHRKLEPLVRLGVPYHGVRGSIGTWGEGLKVAVFSLANDVEIQTHFKGEQPVAIRFGKEWLDAKDWTVPVYKLGKDEVPAGATRFILNHLVRKVDWSEMMRELGVRYGHKTLDLEEQGHKVRLAFQVDGQEHHVKFRALASQEALRERMAWPPNFQPREFKMSWTTDTGQVHARMIVALTARHSGETSGVYLYGNGRLFARAQRTRAVGYADAPNSFLRDHPTCWRVHIFVFLTADDGTDIPWQAPLKDGVSENHHVTTHVREFIKSVVGPYARFAKVAKEADLVPYTPEWQKMGGDEKAKVLFGNDDDDSVARLKALPKEVLQFNPPTKVESTAVGTRTFEKLSQDLDAHAKHARAVIARRGQEGAQVQEMVLKSLNPSAFIDHKPNSKVGGEPSSTMRVARTRRLVIELREIHLERLKEALKVEDDRDAVVEAVAFTLEKLEGKGIRRA
jgi:hypothetical protein